MRTLVYDSLVELRRGGTAMFACKNRGLHEAITPAFLQDSATSGRGFIRNLYSRSRKGRGWNDRGERLLCPPSRKHVTITEPAGRRRGRPLPPAHSQVDSSTFESRSRS